MSLISFADFNLGAFCRIGFYQATSQLSVVASPVPTN
jgi:hypothetical protein